jgi:Icc-related predicted phosphoesterase
VKILAVSDTVVDSLYSAGVSDRFEGVDFVVSCGDLPYFYPEYLLSMLNVSLLFVRGNHDMSAERWKTAHPGPMGGYDLHKKIMMEKGVIFAGVEGSLRYKDGPFMYSQSEMWMNIFGLIPRLVYNRQRYGRYLDVFVTHAPPFGINDREDPAHQGVKAFKWFDRVFAPRYHLHGHVHLYNTHSPRTTHFENTKVINCYGFQEIEVSACNS